MKKLFIPQNYKERLSPTQYIDIKRKDEFQKEVYQKAVDLCKENNFSKVVDLGCGSAYKLLNYFPKNLELIGVEEATTYTWLTKRFPEGKWLKFDSSLKLEPFDLLVCADVIEHIVDVISFIDWIAEQPWKIAIISTPERQLLKGIDPNGPPLNPSHVREWNMEELSLLISQWFDIDQHTITNSNQATQAVIVKKKYNKIV